MPMKIKPITKPKPLKKGKNKISSQQKKAKLRKKADRLLQEVCRKLYSKKGCEICGGEYSCVHHFTPKSCSNTLRYDFNNLIRICASCHFRHHSSNDPRIHAEILNIKDKDWYDELEFKRNNIVWKDNIKTYEGIIKTLEALL